MSTPAESDQKRVVRRIGGIGLVASIFLAVAIPVVNSWISIQHQADILKSDATLITREISQVVAGDTEMWRFLHDRLVAVLELPPFNSRNYQLRIFDAGGRLVAESEGIPKPPHMTQSRFVWDVDRKIARVQVGVSLLPLLREFALVGLLGILIGGLNYVAFRVLPLRSILQAWEDISESEARFLGILENASDAIVSVDENQKITQFNREAERVFGYSADEVLGQPHDLLLSDWRSVKRNIAEEVAGSIGESSSDAGESAAVYGMHKTGERFPVEVAISRFQMKGQTISTAVIRDLTGQLRAEEEIKALNASLEKRVEERTTELAAFSRRLEVVNRLASMVGSSLDPDAIFRNIVREIRLAIPCERCLVTAWDQKMGAMVNMYVESDIEVKRRWAEVKGEEAWGGKIAEASAIQDIPDTRKSDSPRVRELAESGFLSVLRVPIRSEGEFIAHIGLASTRLGAFSEEHKTMLTLAAAQIGPAIRNVENHTRLREALEELHRSQEMSLRVAKLSSVGTLAAGAAHEILNPAGVIRMRAELIAEDTAEDSLENQSAQIIVLNVDRIKKICDDLRRFSRDEISSKEPFDPAEALRFSLGLIEHEFASRGINVALELNGAANVAMGDPGQIQQVFVNLLSNARDAMPRGGVLSISGARTTFEGNPVWEVRVSDTGAGIPEEVLPNIFDPFFTTKEPDEGTGLGLSILHGILEDHGGAVSVESRKNVGTTFTVRLPIKESD